MASMVVHGHSPRLTLSIPGRYALFQSARNASQSRSMPRAAPRARSSSRMEPRQSTSVPYVSQASALTFMVAASPLPEHVLLEALQRLHVPVGPRQAEAHRVDAEVRDPA